jgi:hypothetical protein
VAVRSRVLLSLLHNPNEKDFFGEVRPADAVVDERKRTQHQNKVVLIIGGLLVGGFFLLIFMRNRAAAQRREEAVVQQTNIIALTPHGTPWASL